MKPKSPFVPRANGISQETALTGSPHKESNDCKAVDTVIRELKQWTFVIENSSNT